MRPLPLCALLVACLLALLVLTLPTNASEIDACRGGQCRVERVRLVERDGVKRERSIKRIWTRR